MDGVSLCVLNSTDRFTSYTDPIKLANVDQHFSTFGNLKKCRKEEVFQLQKVCYSFANRMFKYRNNANCGYTATYCLNFMRIENVQMQQHVNLYSFALDFRETNIYFGWNSSTSMACVFLTLASTLSVHICMRVFVLFFLCCRFPF